MEKVEHIIPYLIRIMAYKQILLNLMDYGFFNRKSKEDAVYDKAVIKHILSDNKALETFVIGVNCINFKNHKKDKKGKLVSVDVSFT